MLATWEAEIRKITIPCQSRQKVSETPISTNKKVGVMACTCLLSYAESLSRRIVCGSGLPGINGKPYLKNT
jgi:hypothetical protein